jgi:ABC-type polysaccharide/polyol phosphate export permease
MMFYRRYYYLLLALAGDHLTFKTLLIEKILTPGIMISIFTYIFGSMGFREGSPDNIFTIIVGLNAWFFFAECIEILCRSGRNLIAISNRYQLEWQTTIGIEMSLYFWRFLVFNVLISIAISNVTISHLLSIIIFGLIIPIYACGTFLVIVFLFGSGAKDFIGVITLLLFWTSGVLVNIDPLLFGVPIFDVLNPFHALFSNYQDLVNFGRLFSIPSAISCVFLVLGCCFSLLGDFKVQGLMDIYND